MSQAEEIKVLQAEYNELHKLNQKNKSRMGNLQSKIDKLKKELRGLSPGVTDHAILRLAERRYGLDVEKLKKEILNDAVRLAVKVGATKLKHDGLEYIISEGVVVTVIA